MVVIQDQRPRDWTYRLAFDKKDLPSLQEMMKHIRETHDVDMIERFNNNCEQFLQGDNPEFPTAQPISISKTDDLVVNAGLQQCINIILGTSAVRWSHVQVSRNNVATTPTVSDTLLNIVSGGPYVIPMAAYGWNEAKGMKLFFGAIGSQDAITNIGGGTTINEMGVFNTATGNGATMLNHETFFNNQLIRNVTQDLAVYANVFIFSCVIEFCPVA